MIETSGRSKINWITRKIEMIGKLKINSRQYVPRICPFKYWCELHNVRSNEFEDELSLILQIAKICL
jgi:hypothetical protein